RARSSSSRTTSWWKSRPSRSACASASCRSTSASAPPGTRKRPDARAPRKRREAGQAVPAKAGTPFDDLDSRLRGNDDLDSRLRGNDDLDSRLRGNDDLDSRLRGNDDLDSRLRGT